MEADTQFSADSDFVFASPFTNGEKPYSICNMQQHILRPAAVKSGLGPIGWHTLRQYLPCMAWRQWGNPHCSKGIDAARFHPDHNRYLWWRNREFNARGSQ